MPVKKAKPNSVSCRPRAAKKGAAYAFDGVRSNSGACRWLQLIKDVVLLMSVVKSLLELWPK